RINDLSGSTLDEGTSAGFDSDMVNKRAIFFFSGHYSQRFRPSFQRPDAVSSNQNMRGILCLVPTTRTRRAKQPVVFRATFLQPQARYVG
ncbi:hypothetical protein M9458_017174, partial [Cirrhinus mrigala]